MARTSTHLPPRAFATGVHLHRGAPGARDWRCRCCSRLLGRVRDDRLHIKVKGFSEYIVTLPCTATCRTCGAVNEITRS